jgi:hypothetical protein
MSFVRRTSIPEQKVVDGRPFPLTLTPAGGRSTAELVGYVRSHRETLLQQVGPWWCWLSLDRHRSALGWLLERY